MIARLAEAQHGVVARWQLLLEGLTTAEIRWRLETGRLHVVHRGVYAVGHPRLGPRGRWMAAVLALGEGAVLSHRAAAALWSLLDDHPPIDVSSSRNARPQAGLRVHRTSTLSAAQRVIRDGIPCTSVARTLLDLAATARPHTVRKAVREAEFRRIFDLREVMALEAHPGRRRLLGVLDELSIGSLNTKSELEDRFLALVTGAGLPRPEVNAALEVNTTYFVDFLWRTERLIAETVGFAAHGRESSFHADSRRILRLRNAGYEVLTFTWRDVTETPDEVLTAVRARLSGG